MGGVRLALGWSPGGGGAEGMGEALTLQEGVEEAGAPLKGGEAGEPGGEGQQGEHGRQDPAPASGLVCASETATSPPPGKGGGDEGRGWEGSKAQARGREGRRGEGRRARALNLWAAGLTPLPRGSPFGQHVVGGISGWAGSVLLFSGQRPTHPWALPPIPS